MSNSCDTDQSDIATLTVNDTIQITDQPDPVTACEGEDVSFSATVEGDVTGYQWETDAGGGGYSAISGATSTTLNLSDVGNGDEGNYRLVIEGVCFDDTTDEVSLTVQDSITITSQPSSTTVCEGDDATFSVTATGEAPISYQWYTNAGGSWSSISGATSSSYTITDVSLSDDGDYRLEVSNGCGTKQSDVATLTVNPATEITSHPTDKEVCSESDVAFGVAATGTGALSYTWQYFDGSSWNDLSTGGDITVDQDSLKIATADTSDSGDYRVIVDGTCGSDTSEVANLFVNLFDISIGRPSPFTIDTNSTTITVQIAIKDHEYIYDLSYDLITPNGQVIPLADSSGTFCTETNANLTFSTDFSTKFDACEDPATGNYKIEGHLTPLHGSDPANGAWKIRVGDWAKWFGSDPKGFIDSVRISFTDNDEISGDLTTVSYNDTTSVPIQEYSGTNVVYTEYDVMDELQVTCYGDTNATAVVNFFGGIPPYQPIEWSTTPDFSSTLSQYANEDTVELFADKFYVRVTDSLGCVAIDSITVVEPPEIIIDSLDIIDINTCYGDSTGEVHDSAYGGTGTLYYSLIYDPTGAADTIGTNTTGDFINLGGGDYLLEVFDQNGCLKDTSFTITQPDSIQIVSETMTSLTDTGATDGTIDVDATGGTPPLLYELYKVNPSDTTFEDSNNDGEFTGLGEGLYYVLVSDVNGCGPKESVDFDISAIEITLDADSVLCAGDSTGIVYAQVTGGVLPYTYEWTSLDTSDMSEDTVRVVEDTPLANDTLANVTAGFYILNVIDSTGINERDTIEVYEPEPLLLDSISPDSSITCPGNQEMFIAHVSGGIAPYTITWYEKSTMDSITTGDTVTLAANNYYIAITDSNGCYTLDSVNITEPDPITIVSESFTSLSDPGASDGTIDVDATGGTPPLTYELYEIGLTDTTFITSNNTGDFSGLSEGTYYVLVDDVNGCGPVESSDFNISYIDITLTTDSVDCAGDSTGTVYAEVDGGVLPYTYEWTSLDTSDMSEDTVRIAEDSPYANDTLRSVGAGFYILNVEDSTGINTRDTIEVFEPEPLLLDSIGPDSSVLCYGDQETFIAYVSGGISPYTITWYEKATMDSVTTGDTVTLGANSYYISITDSNGCFTLDSVTITQPDQITIVSENFTPLSSPGASDGTIDIDATGGTPPLEYILYKFTSTDTTGVDTTNDGDFTGLSEGDYFVVVTDVNGCDSAKSSDIRIAPLEINFTEVEPVTCAFDSNGRVIAEVIGGFAPYDYEWTNFAGDTIRTNRGSSSNTDTLSNVAGGNYILNVIDSIDNTDKDTVFVYEPNPLSIVEIIPDTLSAPGASDGSIEVTTAGGNDTIFFDINNLDDGSADSQAIPTANDTANALFSNLTGGDYEIIVYDENGCGYLSDTVNIIHFELTMDKQSLACSGDTDGLAIANISGGTPPFEYDWNTEPAFIDSARTDTLKGLSAGWYYITITDHNGFVLEDSIYVDEPAPVSFAIDTVAGTSVYDFYSDTALLNCPEDTAEFYVSPVGGTTPYTIVWYNQATMDTVAVGDSIVLNYNDYLSDTTGFIVEVTDSNGCSTMDELIIIQPEPVQITNIYPDWTTISNNLTVGGIGGNSRLIFRLIKQDGQDTTLYPADSTYFMQGDTTFAVFQGIPGGNYLLEAYDSAYCDPDYLEISIPMKINIEKVQKISCPGSGDGIVAVEVLRGNSPFTYVWSTYDTVSQSYVKIKQRTTRSMHDTLYNLSKGWYYVEVTDSFDVAVKDSVYLDESDPIEVVAQSDQAYCASGLTPIGGETGAIRLEVNGGTPYSDDSYSYSWFGQAPVRGKDSLVNITGGTYGFTVVDSLGCTYTDTVQVSSNPNYDIQLSIGDFRDTICMNNDVKLYPEVISKVDSLYWSPLEESFYSVNELDTLTDSPTEETRYSIHVKNARCMTSEEKFVYIYPTLDPYILEDDEEIDDQLSFLEIVSEVNLTAIVENDDSIPDSLITYLWEPANYFTSASGLQSTLSIENLRDDDIPKQPVWFTVEVDHGSEICYENDSIMVNIVPNVTPTDAFSPNGDGINDTWKLKDADTYDNLEVTVFNRWGGEVFRRRPYRNDNAWDGTNSRGRPLPSGTYYYIIDSHEKGVDILSGTVTIIR